MWGEDLQKTKYKILHKANWVIFRKKKIWSTIVRNNII